MDAVAVKPVVAPASPADPEVVAPVAAVVQAVAAGVKEVEVEAVDQQVRVPLEMLCSEAP